MNITDLLTFNLVSSILIFMIAIAGGIWPFYLKTRPNQCHHCGEVESFPAAEAFATGIFLAAGLLHMLPDAAEVFRGAHISYPVPFLIAGTVFLSFLLIEHTTVFLNKHAASTRTLALITLLMLSLHSFFEGTAVGTTMGRSGGEFAAAFAIVIAIIAHKAAAGFALSTKLNKNKTHLFNIIGFFIFAVMTPVGIFVGGTLGQNPLLTPVFNSLAAGTFLYMGTLHGLGRSTLIKNCCNMKEFFFMLIGFTIMAIVAIWT